MSEEEHDPAKMMELWKKYSSPGEQHAELEWFLGEWDVTLKMVMPGAPAQTSKGKATFEWAVEGLWLSHRLEGEMMGRPYTGFGIHGYDKYKKNWVTAMVNNLSTELHTTQGVEVDPTRQVFVEYGTIGEFLTGEQDKPIRTVTRKDGDDRFVLETWDLGIGEKGAVVLEFVYTRKK